MKKVALITGVTGQDGAYLAKMLLDKDYDVWGTTRKTQSDVWRLQHLDIARQVKLLSCDLTNTQAINQLLTHLRPDEIYHLAAQSSVRLSLEDPIPTLQFNIFSTHNLLESIRELKLSTRFFHASSSEIFDPATKSPLSTKSPIRPIHPYGIAKAACHFLIQTYRNNYSLYAVNGILFPHESPLRNRNTLLNLLISQAMAVKNGSAKKICIASPHNIRDIGDGRSYAEAMWQSLQVNTADDYIICSSQPKTIDSLVKIILTEFSLPNSCLEIDETLVRQPNIAVIYGDSSETKKKLGWSNKIPVDETIRSMIQFQKERENEK